MQYTLSQATTSIMYMYKIKALFHLSGVWSTSDRTRETDVRPPRNRVKRPPPIALGCSPRDKLRPIGLGSPTHQPIIWSSTDYLATLTRFWSSTRIIGKKIV